MVDDATLQALVQEELEWEPKVDPAHIGVTARDGIVTLSGHVGSYAEKMAAEQAARRVRGVKAVAQEIQVRLPEDKKWADEEIAQRALHLLRWDVEVPEDRLQVKVEHGVVTLTGEVDWNFQREAAEQDVRRLGGVVAVVNQIRVRPQAAAADVRDAIEKALRRSAELEAAGVKVRVEGGKVTLEGKINSWAERRLLETAAWSAPGVTQVEDRLSLHY